MAFLYSCCRLGLLVGLLFCLCRVVPCRAPLFAVVWCNRVIMRCNRFSVLGGIYIVLLCVLSCDCGAFLRSCGRVVMVCVVFVRMNVSRFVSCGVLVRLYMYLYNAFVVVLVIWWRFIRVCMILYCSVWFALVLSIYRLAHYIRKSNNFHA